MKNWIKKLLSLTRRPELPADHTWSKTSMDRQRALGKDLSDRANRSNEPVRDILAGDQPTTCLLCGARTLPHVISPEGNSPSLETCGNCAQRYLVWND